MRQSLQIRKDLERVALGADLSEVFLELSREYPDEARVAHPTSTLAFLHERSREYALKDAALGAILRAYQGGRGGPGIQAFLLLALWPALVAIMKSKRSQFAVVEDLWADIRWAFLETASAYRLDRRPARIAQNLKLDTLHRICTMQRESCRDQTAVNELRESRRREERERIRLRRDPDPETPLDMADQVVAACKRAVQQGRLSELDRLLVCGTRIYGTNLQSFATERGIGYEAAKKRRQRAEKIIQEFLDDESDDV